MGLLSSFVAEHLLSALEAEFVAVEPSLQATLLGEITSLAEKLVALVESKTTSKASEAQATPEV